MKSKKVFSLTVLSLGLCTLAIAADYKLPEFNEEYRVEGAVTADRQIASEKEPSDREPSSVIAKEKKKAVAEEKATEDKFEPKPWLYRNKLDTAY